MNKRSIITWVIVFGLILVVTNWFQKRDKTEESDQSPIVISTNKTDYSQNQEVILKVKNNTEQAIILNLNCPKNPFRVLRWNGSAYAEITAEAKIDCALFLPMTVEAGKSTNISYTSWNHALFGEIGRYKIELPLMMEKEQKIFATEEFTVEERGMFGTVWDKVFYQPLYNLLVFFTRIAPLRDLGIAIILLTLLVRLIILIPSQRAMKAQKRLQEVQPKLDAIKKQFAGNQERIAQETMALWKKEKVSPFGSCLPLLIQFPFLIALYYVIRNGLNPDSSYLLYAPLQSFDFQTIHAKFLGILDLTRVNIFVLPLMIGILQFVQMKLSFTKKPDDKKPGHGSEMQQANQMMTYMMPVMIALFTASVPAGVGLYWGVSTLFGIGQQVVVNRGKVLEK